MPSSLPVNMQQVFQMGTYTEKLQHTILTLSNVTAQQEDKKRIEDDDLKHSQVKNINSSDITENINDRNQSKRRYSRPIQNQLQDEGNSLQLSFPEHAFPEPSLPEDPREGKIIIVA